MSPAGHIPPERANAIAAFYTTQAPRLRRVVASQVSAPAEIIDDACQNAWAALIRRPDITLDRCGFAWLARVAISHVWRETRRQRRQLSADLLEADSELGQLADPVDQRPAPIQYMLAREAVMTLTGRQRQLLALQLSGLSYHEIAARTGTTTRTVERQLSHARRKLREEGG